MGTKYLIVSPVAMWSKGLEKLLLRPAAPLVHTALLFFGVPSELCGALHLLSSLAEPLALTDREYFEGWALGPWVVPERIEIGSKAWRNFIFSIVLYGAEREVWSPLHSTAPRG